MTSRTLRLILALTILMLPAGRAFGQAADVHKSKPHLKRDRTQRVLVPRIIQFEDERVVTDQLVDLVGMPHGSVRRRAIIALGRIGSPRGIAPLVTVLTTDKDPQLRALAAFSLGEIESYYAFEPLLERLQNAGEEPLVRARVIEALGKIGANRTAAASLGPYATNSVAMLIAGSMPGPSRDLGQDEKLQVSLSLTALMRLKRPDTAKIVAAQLKSRDPELRWQAANALARMSEGIAQAVPDLLPLLEDSDALVRAHAARALGVSKD